MNLLQELPNWFHVWLWWVLPIAAIGGVLAGLIPFWRFLSNLKASLRMLVDVVKQNRFDDRTVAVTRVSHPIAAGPYAGHVVVHLRTLRQPTDEFKNLRGKEGRDAMDVAARKCTWEIPRRFLLVGERHEGEVRRVLLNWLGPLFESPDQQKWLLVGPTGADADPEKHSKKSYRMIIIRPDEALRLHIHAAKGAVLFEDGRRPNVYHKDPKHSHMTRVGTVLCMVQCMESPDWRIDIPVNGHTESHQICFPMQGDLDDMPPLDYTKMEVIEA